MDGDETEPYSEDDGAGPVAAPVASGRFVSESELARGGGGRIVRARDTRLERIVALKYALARDGERRLASEIAALSALQHPAIVPIYDGGLDADGRLFYAMRLVDGRSLHDAIRETRRFADRLAMLPAVVAIADAVAYAHDRGILHRDLKPGNVLVGAFGETVVIDWGLAKATAAETSEELAEVGDLHATAHGAILGTPAYMAPEQASAGVIDARTDVYALGAILYELLAGDTPYAGSQRRLPVLDGPPTAIAELEPRAPADLVAIAETAMARDPATRYASASELAADLRRFQTGALVAARRYPAIVRAARWVGRHRLAVGAAALVVAAGAIAAVATARRTPENRDRCVLAAADVHAIWNDARATQIELALGDTKHWSDTDLVPALRDYANALAAARVDVCELGDDARELADRRTRCLDLRAAELARLLVLLGRADPRVSRHAMDAVSSLEDVARCDASRVAETPVAPPATDDLRDRIAAAKLEVRFGDDTGIERESAELLVEARASGGCVLEAEALLLRGLAIDPRTTDPRPLWREAIRIADACGADHARAGAMTALLRHEMPRGDVDARFRDLARDSAAAVGRGGDGFEHTLVTSTAFELVERAEKTYLPRGDIDGALELVAVAKAMYLSALGTDRSSPTAEANFVLAEAELQRKNVAPAIAALEDAARINVRRTLTKRLLFGIDGATPEIVIALLEPIHDDAERLLGATYPNVVNAGTALSFAYRERGDFAHAAKWLEHNAVVLAAKYGPEEAGVVVTRLQIGMLWSEAHDHARTIATLTPLLPFLEREMGKSFRLVMALDELAVAELATGHTVEAIGHFERALALDEDLDGRAATLISLHLADAWLDRGDPRRARAAAEAARAKAQQPSDEDDATRWLHDHPAP